MKLLITGANGQLGKEWTDFCSRNKINYEALGSEELDIRNPEHIQERLEEFQPDVIINCAAYTNVDAAEDERDISLTINASGVATLAEVCAKKNLKLVHYSTDYVFPGNPEDKEKYPDGYPEEAETNPINQYGASKRLGEEELINSGCDFILIRVAWLCGKYGNNFVKTMLGLGREKDFLSVVDDQFGSPTFCEDVVSKSFKLIQENEKGIFHISSFGLITWFNFAEEIFKQAGIKVDLKPVSSEEYKTKAKRPAFSKLSTQKISTIDGIEIQEWKVGLHKLINQLV